MIPAFVATQSLRNICKKIHVLLNERWFYPYTRDNTLFTSVPICFFICLFVCLYLSLPHWRLSNQMRHHTKNTLRLSLQEQEKQRCDLLILNIHWERNISLWQPAPFTHFFFLDASVCHINTPPNITLTRKETLPVIIVLKTTRPVFISLFSVPIF